MPAVKLEGVKYVLSQLNKVTPESRKEVMANVRVAAKPLVRDARGYVPSKSPLSGWLNKSGDWGNRAFDSSAMKRGIGFSTASTRPNRRGFSYVAYFYNKTAAGAIYETAGRKHPNGQPWDPRTTRKRYSHSANPKAGQQFIQALGSVGQGQMAGRAMFRAWNNDNGKIKDAIIRSYTQVIAKFNRGIL